MRLIVLSSCLAIGFALSGGPPSAAGRGPSATAPTTGPAAQEKVFAVVFDFAGPDGDRLADSIRLALRRQGRHDVLDRLSTQEAAGPVAADAEPTRLIPLLRRLASSVGIYGTVSAQGKARRVEVCRIDLAGGPLTPRRRTFTDRTERWRGVIAGRIVQAVTGATPWAPPQYGDESEPAYFARPLNRNGSFEGSGGWDLPDNVSTFIEPGPAGHGKVLRIRTDLARDAWLAYRRKLLFGQADRNRPPTIARDTSYASLAGLEGVHFAGEWIKATPSMRYWLTADVLPAGGTPKVFVKGFRKADARPAGLPEQSLAELGITPEMFAQMPPEQRKQMILRDAGAHPMRYLRECYRWYLNLRGPEGKWSHHAAGLPPRGGLPERVQWLQIQVYAHWPPGEYLFDNVNLYADPRQKAPLPVERPRTPGFEAGQAATGPATQPAGTGR